MQINILKFLSDNSGDFNCFQRALILKPLMVRPLTDSEISKIYNLYNIRKCDNSCFVSLCNSENECFGVVRIFLNSDQDIYFNSLNLEMSDDRILQTITSLIEFFMKNLYINRCFVDEEIPIDHEKFEILRSPTDPIYRIINRKRRNGIILTAGPSITPVEVCYCADAARNGWNSDWNSYLVAFEKEFAAYVGSKHAIATSSCTGALQISLLAIGIQPGDEVIVPDLTWVASATAIRDVGAVPVFADIEEDSWNIDPAAVAARVTPRTKAVVVVHMYGGPARMRALSEVCTKHGLKIVEDAAPAIGAQWEGRNVGTFGSFGCFSFQGAKLLVTGEGGMLVTDDTELYYKAKKIADQGRNPDKVFWIDDHGVKFKMSNVQAALGLAQIRRADENIMMKRRVFEWYADRLEGHQRLKLNREIENGKSIYWMSSIRLLENAQVTRDDLINKLKAKGIDTRPVFPAISQYPIWKEKSQANVNAKIVGSTSLNLPSGVGLSRSEVDYICDEILKIV